MILKDIERAAILERAIAFRRKFVDLDRDGIRKGDADGELLAGAMAPLEEAASIRTDVDRDRFAANADQLIEAFRAKNPGYKRKSDASAEGRPPADDDQDENQAQPAKKSHKAARPDDEEADEEEAAETDQDVEDGYATKANYPSVGGGFLDPVPRRRREPSWTLAMSVPMREWPDVGEFLAWLRERRSS